MATLVAEKLDHGFRLYLAEDPNRSYYIGFNLKDPKTFTVTEEKRDPETGNWEVTSVTVLPYLKVEVDDLCKLFVKTVLQPSAVLKVVTGKDVAVEEVVMRDHGKRTAYGFTNCSFATLTDPLDLGDDDPF
jgi:hypothetical protein